jgi:hypothetical protein
MAGRALILALKTMNLFLSDLQKLLMVEGGLFKEHAISPSARKLNKARGDLLAHVREIGKSDYLSLMVAAERTIVADELKNHANSKGMVSSLTAALAELSAAGRLLSIIDDPDRYHAVDQAHSLHRNRDKKDLPLDEARQAFKSHCARLGNLDKSRLDDSEKEIIDARKANMSEAGKLYTERQAKTLAAKRISDICTSSEEKKYMKAWQGKSEITEPNQQFRSVGIRDYRSDRHARPAPGLVQACRPQSSCF